MKLDKRSEESKKQPTKSNLTTFSKVGDIKVPDSPPPEKEEEPEEGGGMSKFERMMKAAVSIKSA